MIQPGLRPELPASHNLHKFPHHGLYGDGRGRPKGQKNAPYEDPKEDIKSGEQVADEQEKEESFELKEFFKFTRSATDNTSFYRPPTMGRGAMAAYGKGLEDYSSFDPSYKDSKKQKKRKRNLKGRADTQVGAIPSKDNNPSVEPIEEKIGTRDIREPNSQIVTKSPWANGMPTNDKKDIEAGYKVADQQEKEELNEDYYNSKKSADTSFGKMDYQRLARMPKADLAFWDYVNKHNIYGLSQPEDFDEANDEEKDQDQKK